MSDSVARRELKRARRIQAALLIAMGVYSYAQVAERIGVSLRTVQRWLQQPDFQELIEDKRFELRKPLDDGYRRRDQLALQVTIDLLNSIDVKKVGKIGVSQAIRIIDAAGRQPSASPIDKSTHDKIKDMLDGLEPPSSE